MELSTSKKMIGSSDEPGIEQRETQVSGPQALAQPDEATAFEFDAALSTVIERRNQLQP